MSKKKYFLALLSLFMMNNIRAGNEETWDLERCIQYALENNIQIQKSNVSEQQQDVSLKESQAALFPSLSFGMNQSLNYRPLQSNPNSIVANWHGQHFQQKADRKRKLFIERLLDHVGRQIEHKHNQDTKVKQEDGRAGYRDQ